MFRCNYDLDWRSEKTLKGVALSGNAFGRTLSGGCSREDATYIVWCIKKQTNLWVGHFMTLSGLFLANYIIIFHKIELQTIILMCLTCLNLIWIKSYDIKHIFFISCFLQFCKKNTENLWLINGHFRTISGHFLANCMKIFHKKEVQTVILRCLVGLNLNWIKNYDIILVKIFFYHAWKCSISWLVCRSEFWPLLKKLALIFSKWLFFQNSFGLSWNT